MAADTCESRPTHVKALSDRPHFPTLPSTPNVPLKVLRPALTCNSFVSYLPSCSLVIFLVKRAEADNGCGDFYYSKYITAEKSGSQGLELKRVSSSLLWSAIDGPKSIAHSAYLFSTDVATTAISSSSIKPKTLCS